MSDIIEVIKKVTAPMHRRIFNMIARGVIKAVSDSGKLQTLQLALLKDELADKIERVQEYGFTSHPKAGAEALVVFLNGSRDHGVAVGVDDRRYRLKDLLEGEVALYNHEGCKLVWRNGKKLEVNNDQEELITVLSDLCAWLLAARVMTVMGPQQFIETDRNTLLALKARLDTFKV